MNPVYDFTGQVAFVTGASSGMGLATAPRLPRGRFGSAGSASPPRLGAAQFVQLEAEVAKGPVAHGWPDQRWTLSRIKTVIGRRFHKSYALQGVRKPLIRHRFSCQIPARCAVERDEEAICGWVKETWPHVEAPRRRSGHGPSSRTSPASR